MSDAAERAGPVVADSPGFTFVKFAVNLPLVLALLWIRHAASAANRPSATWAARL